MKITKRQLRKIIKESVTDTIPYEAAAEQSAAKVADLFYKDMMALFEETPEAFEGRTNRLEWEEQVVYAIQEIETGITAAIEEVIQRIETQLHDGEYDTGGETGAYG